MDDPYHQWSAPLTPATSATADARESLPPPPRLPDAVSATGAAAPTSPHSPRMSGLAVASISSALLGALPLALGALQAVLLSHGIVLITAEDFGVSFDPGPYMQVFYGAFVVLLGFPTLAVIIGHLARWRIRRAQGQLRGKRYANTALVIAYLQLTIELPVVLMYALFFIAASQGGL